MNPECGKRDIKKSQVEFDESSQTVLCHGCYAIKYPNWVPETDVVVFPPHGAFVAGPQWEYEIQLTSRDGFKAKVSYGSVSIGFHAPSDDLKKLMGFTLKDRVS
jgi:hypothetical protein